MYVTDLPWTGFLVGLLALGAAWFGGERFVLREVRALSNATQRLAAGDWSSRTGLSNTKGELGELARTFDRMAEILQQRVLEREEAEQTMLNRALQQTVVAALGQFALISNDFDALLDQAVRFVAQTLEVEFCNVLELLPGREQLLLRSGVGWKDDNVGKATVEAGDGSYAGYALFNREPILVNDAHAETRFTNPPLLTEHGIVSGVTVAIATRKQPYGILGAHTARPRKFTGDEAHFLMSVATVLAMAAERQRTEAEMQKLAAFARLNPNPVLELAADGMITYFNEAAMKLARSLNQNHPRQVLPPDIAELVHSCLTFSQMDTRLETHLDGRTLTWSFHPVTASQVVHCYVKDITNDLNMEAQLRQSQKMQSVGQLAAGVAHDFNNMLTIIQGHSGRLMAKPNLPMDLFDSAQAIYFAAERAAGLTRQLLMFSRKNVMQPRALDLREIVGNLTKMLQRLLGETVTLKFNPLKELPLIEADAGMVEQVIMNLSVNARDAMSIGGILTISTTPVEITETYVQTHPEARVGTFVCLRVTDTGCGMDAITINRIFEPFFTTKEVGKGTGLGLATAYGIVKQHFGWIQVASELGVGSTFEVFFPASGQAVKSVVEETDPAAFVRGGDETILVVEDEPVLRDMARLILEEHGYHVLEAPSGREAFGVWNQHQDDIDLLLTDMVMPEGVSGVDLAQKLMAKKPRLKVIFTSGYTMDDVSGEFLAHNNAQFLQKPYTRTTLAHAVRKKLDEQPAGQMADTPVAVNMGK
jgi:signal transduction histidine kinase/CheY-like chemotaxis protein/HAMP domain-containing protein